MAATSTTEEELATSRKKMNDGTKPVEVERRPYRPALDSVYMEPEYFPDEDDGIEILYKDSGTAILQDVRKLPPRTDKTVWYKTPGLGPRVEKSYRG